MIKLEVKDANEGIKGRRKSVKLMNPKELNFEGMSPIEAAITTPKND